MKTRTKFPTEKPSFFPTSIDMPEFDDEFKNSLKIKPISPN